MLTDLGTEVTTKVVRNISDHEAVLGTLDFEIDEVFTSERKVYDFKKAPWSKLTQYFRDIDWTAALADGNADNSAQRLLDTFTEGIDLFLLFLFLSAKGLEPFHTATRARRGLTMTCRKEARSSPQ